LTAPPNRRYAPKCAEGRMIACGHGPAHAARGKSGLRKETVPGNARAGQPDGKRHPQQVRVGSYSHRGNTVVRGMIIYESRLGGFRDKIRLIDLPRGLCFLVTGFLRFFHPVAFDFCSSQAHSGAFAVDSDASPNKSQKLGLHVSATSAGYIRRHDMAKPTTIKIRLNSSAGTKSTIPWRASTLNTKKARSSKIDLL